MSHFRQIASNVWIKPATRGWVIYIGPYAQYYPEDQLDQAQAHYNEAIEKGEWASPPMPAHMGT